MSESESSSDDSKCWSPSSSRSPSSSSAGDTTHNLRKPHNKNHNSCKKLILPDHLATFMENRELDRDIETIQCDEDVVEKVFGNYLIVKNILSHLRWQEKLVCQEVSWLWATAVNRLQLEQLGPVDFSINAGNHATRDGIVLLKSSDFCTEPMAVFIFCRAMELKIDSAIACEGISSCPCLPPCGKDHSILDLIHHETTAPRDCMFIVKSSSMLYMPLPHSLTIENIIQKPVQGSDCTFYGMYIPKIPGVKFIVVNSKNVNEFQHECQSEIKKVVENYTIKGVIACLTENYLLYGDNADCLEFLQLIQPNKPFAFGGCLIEDTANTESNIMGIIDSINKNKEYVSGNFLSLGLFVTPKTEEGSTSSKELCHNFEIHSFVLESLEWSRPVIKQAMQEFADSVPRYEHSVCLKFACVGRHHKHDAEQSSFRACFPNTRLIGCFGNGELGVNLPPRKPKPSRCNKRLKHNPMYEKVHSYSSVFFYMGWGKVLEQAKQEMQTNDES